jgi:hypothetical protein
VYTNVLQNPDLQGVWDKTQFTDDKGQVGFIEHPTHWKVVFEPMSSEDRTLKRYPQVLHQERGTAIQAGWRSWMVMFKQTVELKANQRYLAKALFKPDVNFAAGAAANLNAIQWRFRLGTDSRNGVGHSDWQTTGQGAFKQEEELLFPFQSAQDQTLEYRFEVRSPFPNNVCDFRLYTLRLEEVPADYGGPDVPVLGTQSEVDDEAPPMPIPGELQSTVTLLDVLTEKDIDVMQDAANRFFAALKRLKSST